MSTQGKSATKTGRILESQVCSVFKGSGFKFIDSREVLTLITHGDDMNLFGEKWYTTQIAIERNLYKAKFKSDLFVFHYDVWPVGIHIECKYQGMGGSVDEKYVFTVQSLKNLKAPSLLLVTGGGARNCAIEWIRSQETKRFKFCASLDQFNNWIHKTIKS